MRPCAGICSRPLQNIPRNLVLRLLVLFCFISGSYTSLEIMAIATKPSPSCNMPSRRMRRFACAHGGFFPAGGDIMNRTGTSCSCNPSHRSSWTSNVTAPSSHKLPGDRCVFELSAPPFLNSWLAQRGHWITEQRPWIGHNRQTSVYRPRQDVAKEMACCRKRCQSDRFVCSVFDLLRHI